MRVGFHRLGSFGGVFRGVLGLLGGFGGVLEGLGGFRGLRVYGTNGLRVLRLYRV